MIMNCKLCGFVGQVPGLIDKEGKPLDNVSNHCPECGYNTNMQLFKERARQRDKNAIVFDELDFPLEMPAEELINRKIEWLRVGISDFNHPGVSRGIQFSISTLQKAPRDIRELDRKIAVLREEMKNAPTYTVRDNLQFERELLCCIRAIVKRQKSLK